MPDVTESVRDAVKAAVAKAIDQAFAAMDDGTENSRPVPGAMPALLSAGGLWIDPIAGDDARDGRTRDTALRSTGRASELIEPGMLVTLMPGAYRDKWKLRNLGAAENEPVYIRSERVGEAIFTNFIDTMNAAWRPHGGGVYSMPSSAEPWCGLARGRFLPRFKSVNDLTNAKADDVRMPPYGFCQDGERLFVRLPGEADPASTEMMLNNGTRHHIEIINSPHVILDGIGFQGHGDTQAVHCDTGSSHLWAQNCLSTHGRELFRLSDDSIVTWCQYFYPGFTRFAEDLAKANGGELAKLFDYTKNYNHHPENRGNALYEGRMASGRPDRASLRCRFSFNLSAQCFDGFSFGQFSESKSYRDAFWYAYDDAVEFESWRREHDSRDLLMVEPFVVNCFGSAFSHQDTSNQMRGPHRIIRPFVYNPDPLMTPPFLMKNMSMDSGFSPKISYDHGFFHNMSGPSTWGADKNFLFLDHAEGRGARLSIRNSIIVADKIDNWDQDWDPDCDFNALVSPLDYPHIRGPNGLWFKSIDDLKLHGPNAGHMDFRPLPDSPLIGRASDGLAIGPYNPDDELGNRPLITTFTDQTPKPWHAAQGS